MQGVRSGPNLASNQNHKMKASMWPFFVVIFFFFFLISKHFFGRDLSNPLLAYQIVITT